jgi:hypothetical protein
MSINKESQSEMTEEEQDQYELEELEDEYYKTQDEMDGEIDDANDKVHDW